MACSSSEIEISANGTVAAKIIRRKERRNYENRYF